MRNLHSTPLMFSMKARILLALAFCLTAAIAVTTMIGSAATPANGTLTPANDSAHPLQYTDGMLLVPNPTHLALGQPDCTGTNRCSDFTLTVNANSVAATSQIQIQHQWASTSTDFDIFVEDPAGNLVTANASTADPSTIILPIPANGTVYHIVVVLSVGAAQTFTGTISVIPIPPPTPQGAGAPPRYENYPAPQGVADNAGEPSIGVDWNPNVASLRDTTPPTKKNVGGVTFFTSGANEFRSNFDDCCSPAVNQWDDVSAVFTQQSVLSDPIGFVDHYTSEQLGLGGAQPQTPGRVFSIDLLGGQGNSAGSYSDDDGNNYLPGATGGPGQGADHETLGGGPYSSQGGTTPPSHSYPNAIYYCSQNGAVEAQCSRSDDGGQTFGPGIPIFNTAQCTGGIHGHVKVARDGTVYVPNSSCGAGGADGAAVSKDNGMTWNEFNVPASTGSQDPSVGIGQNDVGKPGGQASNTVYLGWISGDGHPHIAHSPDQGATWADDTDVGSVFGLQSACFPVVVAGDDNRAAYGFLGTTTPGLGAFSDPNFQGVWHLYIATTYDGGHTYIVIDATPNDPVQTGEICLGGLSCSSAQRGLLDFNDISVDAEGRPVLGYADGCINCDNTYRGQSSSSHATIARQSGGRRLFAAFDPVEPAPPAAPQLETATRNTGGVLVKWLKPDNGGSTITGYKVYRGATSGTETFLANVSGELNTSYQDTTANPANTYFYRVTGVNAHGEGAFCREVTVTGSGGSGTSCAYPYLNVDGPGHAGNVATDPTQGELTIQSVNIGEPFTTCEDKSITFRMKVNTLDPADTGSPVLPANSEWQILFNVIDTNGNPQQVYVSMDTLSPASPANPEFTYGRRDPGTTGTLDSAECTNLSPIGGCPAITGSYDKDGTIIIKLEVADPLSFTAPTGATGVAFNWDASNPGTQLTSVTGNTFLFVGVGAGFLETVQTTSGGGYTTVGNISCEPHIPPTARITAAPMSGTSPLLVNFNGSTSTEPDPCDTLTNYTLDFGDGSPTASQVSPLFTHTYTCPGPGDCDYPARLTVTDSRSDTSTNQAQVIIHVTPGGGASPTPTPTPSPTPGTCLNTPAQVLTDPGGDQGAANPLQVDIESLSAGEDYRYINSQRLVFKLKVHDLGTIPANQVWNVRWTFGGTTYYVAMKSDGSSTPNVSYDYGTIASNMITILGAVDSGSYSTDGTITLIIAMSKVGNPTSGSLLTAVNGLTQMNVGGALFTGEDSTSSSTYTVRPQDPGCTPGPIPVTGNVTYLKGGLAFSPNYATKAPYIGQDVEPSVRCDKFGNCYVAAIRGVPAGTDLWYFDLRPTVNGSPNPNYDPYMRNPQYRGQPDSISGMDDTAVGGDGGGDVDIAVGFNSEATENPNAPPTLAYTSLVAGNISTQRSTDRGATFTQNPAGNVTGGVPGDDRQWLEFLGANTVYLFYRTLEPAVSQIQRSTDGGLTYGPTTTAGTIGQAGSIAVDQNDGTVYVSGSNGVVAVGVPPAAGLAPVNYTVHNVAGTGNAHLFFIVKVAADGTVYACYSDDSNVYVKYSLDKANTWSPAIRVSDGSETHTAVFPWMTTGPVPGTIGVVWYGSDKNSTGDDSADWHVFYALGTGVTSNPVFRQAEAGDHIIHGANISENGLVVAGQSPNRNLADYFQVAFDPTGAAVIGYCDDHNDLSGHTYVTRQISGPGSTGDSIPAPVEGSGLPAPTLEPVPTAASVGGIAGSQVTDFAQDVRTGGNPQTGGLVVPPVNDPLDILSVKYTAEPTSANDNAPMLVGTMKVSDMAAIPVSSNWRISFAANVPNSVVSPTGQYSFGTSDRGDQFFVRATTDGSGAQTFVYGTATRTFSGGVTYTDRGAADCGFFDPATQTITVKVALSKLNAYIPQGHTVIGTGSILAGLRATTFTSASGGGQNSGNNKTDTARGGTQFTIALGPLTPCGPLGSACTSPHSGTISPASNNQSYCGGPFAVSNPTAPLGNTPPACATGTCDFYNLTVSIPANDPNTYQVTVNVGWTNSGSLTTQGGTTSDFDLYVYKPDETGAKVGQGGGSSNPEIATFTVTSGTYTVYVVPYDVQPDVSFNGTITLTQLVAPTPTPTPSPSPTPETPGVPRYFNYAAPNGLGTDAGEPSIGVNWNSEQLFNNSMFSNIPNGGTSMFESNVQTLRVTFDDCPSPANSLWADKSAPNAATSLDPILFTDHGYNHVTPNPFRTFSSQLTGVDSLSAYTDDDGENWTPSQGGGIPSGYDHQTIGAGPYNPNSTPAPPPHPLYPNAVYYCSQEAATAFCARSDDGGLNFGPGVPTWNTTQCGGIHGHVKVAPDGTVYVPNWNCTPGQGVAVSTDNGITWTVRNITGATKAKGLEDPSIGIASDNTVYFGYQNGDGHPHVAVSHDQGQNWINNTDVGVPFGIRNAVYPAVTAGDGNRAAMAFIGTTEPGDYVAQTDFNTGAGFQGVWHLYIATTLDGGQNWTTVDATPNDPVQRGSICDQGTVTCNRSPNDRNLLDFIGIDTDKEGRVLVAYADGCIGSCVNGGPNSYSALATIVRQSGGNRLFHEFDPVEPALPNAPRVNSVYRNADNWVTAKWSAPDGNGASITGYKIYRGTSPGGETLLATLDNVRTYFDFTANAPGVTYYYKISALNAQGEGPTCHEFSPTPAPPEAPSDPCLAPGVQVLDDTSDGGQNTPADGSVDIKKLFISELGTDADQLTFRLQVAPSALTMPPPNSQWFIIWKRRAPEADFDRWYVAMRTDAAGATSFEYGKFGVPLDTSGNGVPNPNSNTPVKVGDADSGTYDLATAVIIIKLSTSKAENVQAGQTLGGLNARTFLNRPDAGQRSQNNASDITDDGDYRLVGNGACQLFTISGHIAYGVDNSKSVKDVMMTLTGGATPKTTMSGANGDYSLGNVPINSSYTLTPSKPDEAHDQAITAFDASHVARYDAGLESFTATQLIAGDVTGDGTVSAFDASRIARYDIQIPTPGSIAGSWKFLPTSKSYPSLSSNQASQDFQAILVGDVTGNWIPPAGPAPALRAPSKATTKAPAAPGATITVSLPFKQDAPGPTTIPITVGDTTGQGIGSYALDISFDSSVLQPQATPYDTAGTLSSGWLITPNTATTGHLILNAFSTTDMTGQGILLNLKFNVVGGAGAQTPLTWVSFTFNEGTPQDADINGQFTVGAPTAAPGRISGQIVTSNGQPVSGATVTVTGGARTLKTITNSEGRYQLVNVETGRLYTVTPARANYTFSPAERSFSLIGDKTDATFTGQRSSAEMANDIDTPEFFVRQQYLDFLGREPDQAGFEYWTDQISRCNGDSDCLRAQRIGVSAAFFVEQEFQETGTFIYDLYKGGLGRRPVFTEYSQDRQQVVGGANLETRKSALAEAFVQREEFTSKYQANTTAESFVDALIQNVLLSSGVDLSAQRDSYVGAYNSGSNMSQSRGLVMRALADGPSLKQAEYNRAFVLAQYFSYLKREPDTNGYNFWVDILANNSNNYRGMVCAFITSSEYQDRFGTVRTHSNAECGGTP